MLTSFQTISSINYGWPLRQRPTNLDNKIDGERFRKSIRLLVIVISLFSTTPSPPPALSSKQLMYKIVKHESIVFER
jgi:hypothetical protein